MRAISLVTWRKRAYQNVAKIKRRNIEMAAWRSA